MYTLILTLIISGMGYPPATTMTTVPGFTSEAACLRAGNAWIAQQRKVEMTQNLNVRAMCVGQ